MRDCFLNFFLVVSLIIAAMLLGQNPALSADQAAKKPLVVYFSQSGHTKQIAEDIHNKVGGDIIAIETVEAYPADYQALTDQAKDEQKRNARPAIKTTVPNIDEYGIIFLGFPNWWSGMPMPVHTFLDQNKLDGKTIVPFMTHGGGGQGHAISDLKKALPHAKVLKPFTVSGTKASTAAKDVEKWLEGLGNALIETTTGNTAIYPDGAY